MGLRTLAIGGVLLFSLSSCVRTAECDDSLASANGSICYDYECQAPCEGDDECDAGLRCTPCEVDGRDRCIGSYAAATKACVSGL